MLARDAHAESGNGVGLGPVFDVGLDGSVSLGWEVGGTYRLPFFRLSLGGSYRVLGESSEPSYFHYLAWEPWVYVGGTLGVAATPGDRPARFLYGIWEGYAQDLGDPFLDSDLDYIDDERLHWILSVSIGWRGVGKAQHFYVSPKIWRLQGWDFFT